MLVVHPSSTCDVCLEGYTGNPKLMPHSIACGHVFCLDCLHHLRQLRCPLCRSPFEESSIRRIHVDRSDQGNSDVATPNSPVLLPSPNSPSIPRRSPTAKEESVVLYRRHLESKALAIVRNSGGSFTSNMYDLVEEIRAFLGQNPHEESFGLKASLLLLYRLNDMQGKLHESEKTALEQRAEILKERQSLLDAEKRYHDIQEIRMREQDSSRAAEARLRDHMRSEEMEWRRKYDGAVAECRRLRCDLDKLRSDSITCKLSPSSPMSCAETIRPLSPVPKVDTPTKPTPVKPSVTDFGGSKFFPDFDEDSLLADFFQLACKSNPQQRDKGDAQNLEDKLYGMFTKAVTPKPRSPARPLPSPTSEVADGRGRSSSFSGGISRASDQAPPPLPRAIRIPARQRSDSLPSAPLTPLGEQEMGHDATSLPNRSSTSARGVNTPGEPLSPAAATEAVPEVFRLHALLEKTKPIYTPQSRSAQMHQVQDATSYPTRPPFGRSASLHQHRVVPQAKSNLSSSLPTSNNIPSSINEPSSYSMSPSISSPSQLPVQHRFIPAGAQQVQPPPRIPALQQETRVRGERRGSVSTASSAAQAGSREQPLNTRFGQGQQTSPVQQDSTMSTSSLARKPPVVAAHDFWTPQISQLSSSVSSSG